MEKPKLSIQIKRNGYWKDGFFMTCDEDEKVSIRLPIPMPQFDHIDEWEIKIENLTEKKDATSND